ncbi:homeobox protein 4-like [Daktulosphaira vitifoliae]|uniref:homeobox protein 4-like n=1 Tax=Daktulosphaira vitifoliae TaxID=58002 RepID=UPI0021AACA6F|nr:homeobox protein 4-like [Daktulosphaira vitifoliae]
MLSTTWCIVIVTFATVQCYEMQGFSFPEKMVIEEIGLTDVTVTDGVVTDDNLNHNYTTVSNVSVVAGNLNDALMTMSFHREKIQDYLCRQYVAEEILQEIAGNSMQESRSVSSSKESDVISNMRFDQGSAVYNNWLNKAQIMKKIYDEYDLNIRMQEQPQGFKLKLKNNESLGNHDLTSKLNIQSGPINSHLSFEDPILNPSGSSSIEFIQSQSVPFNDQNMYNNVNNTDRMQPPNLPIYYGPPQMPPMSYGPPNIANSFPMTNFNGYFGQPNPQIPTLTTAIPTKSPVISQADELGDSSANDSNEGSNNSNNSNNNNNSNNGVRQSLTASDLYDLVLTAIAFLGFGTFVMNLVMDAMSTPNIGATLMMSPASSLGSSVSRNGRQLNLPMLEIDELAWTVVKGVDNLIASVDGETADCGLAKKICQKSKKLINSGINFSSTLLPAWNVALSWLSNKLGKDTGQPVILAFINQCSIPVECR